MDYIIGSCYYINANALINKQKMATVEKRTGCCRYVVAIETRDVTPSGPPNSLRVGNMLDTTYSCLIYQINPSLYTGDNLIQHTRQ